MAKDYKWYDFLANPIWPVMSFSEMQKEYDRPYNEARNANTQAGQESEALGGKAFELGMYGVDRALDQTLPAARFWERTYGQGGELSGPGALEKYAEQADPNEAYWNRLYGQGGELADPGAVERLYEERRTGRDPFADLQRKRGQEAIDKAFSARLLQNSGAALRATSDLNEGISADLFRRQEALAQAAQGAREGRFGAAFDRRRSVTGDRANLLGAAQGAKETRLGGAFDRVSGLGQHRAGVVQSGVQGAIDNYTSGQLGGINARLNASNVGVRKRQDELGFGAQAGGAFAGSFA